jgi:hypothetical protein
MVEAVKCRVTSSNIQPVSISGIVSGRHPCKAAIYHTCIKPEGLVRVSHSYQRQDNCVLCALQERPCQLCFMQDNLGYMYHRGCRTYILLLHDILLVLVFYSVIQIGGLRDSQLQLRDDVPDHCDRDIDDRAALPLARHVYQRMCHDSAG